MNNYISINSKTLRKFLKRYKLTIIGNQEIIKVSQKDLQLFLE